ncbi:MAG: hypothetical protein CL816_01760 [Coxiellaceae bacterium]|nr:hypothetical protein [Coxiellaceae bacterium]
MYFSVFAYSLLTFMLVIAIVFLLRPAAKKIGLVDRPNLSRKQHQGEVPLIGGIAIVFAAMLVTMLIPHSLDGYRSLFLGIGVLLFVGVLDDLKSLSPLIRLIAQFLVVIIMIAQSNLEITSLGNLFGHGVITLSPVFSMLLTFICVIALINAMNMLDGLDGLLGLVSLSQFFWLSLSAASIFSLIDVQLLWIFIGALVGFLCFNLRIKSSYHARIFLGDAGSTVLGYVAAWFIIDLSQFHDHTKYLHPVIMLWILALPIFDLVITTICRLLIGQSPLVADDKHIHHLLRKCGLSVKQTTYTLAVSSFLMGLIGFTLAYYDLSEGISALCFLLLFISYTVVLTQLKVKVTIDAND